MGVQPPNVGMTTARPDIQKIPPKSQVQLQEVFDNYPQSPCKERARVAFSILNELVDQVGTYSSVLKVIVDELKSTVYSNAVTSSETPPYYEKLPYCVLVDRINKNRVDDEKETKDTIEELRQKLKFREQDLEIVYRKNLQLKQQIEKMEKQEDELRDEIQNLVTEVQLKELETRDIKNEHAKIKEKLVKENHILQASVTQAQQAIEKLTVFNAATSDSSDARASTAQAIGKKSNIEITSKGLLKYDLTQSKLIEKQFSDLLNFILDDFEQTLGQIYRKREVVMNVSSKESQENINSFDAEIEGAVKTFKAKIDKYLAEEALLKRHAKGLELQLKRNEANAKLPSLDSVSDFHNRKYAVMLLVSTDGETFSPHYASQNCVKCGDRVISCPHVEMNPNTFTIDSKTHFKLQHPSMYLRSELKTNEMIENHALANTITEDENPLASTAFLKIWKVFYSNKGGSKPVTNRVFSLERLLEMTEEWYDAKWTNEETTAKEAIQEWQAMMTESPEKEERLQIQYQSFQNFFYDLMSERYVYKEISLKACHDIFTSLELYEKLDGGAALFAGQLSGLETDTWKYVYLVKRLVKTECKQDTLDIPTFRKLVRIIYPDRQNEHYDQMELEVVSFCQNKLSKEQYLKYFQKLMSRKQEPNFTFFMKLFDKLDVQLRGVASFEAFMDIVTKVLPNTDVAEAEARYRLAERECEPDQVPLEKLAMSCCYLMLNNSFRTEFKVTSQIALKYQDFRMTVAEPESSDE